MEGAVIERREEQEEKVGAHHEHHRHKHHHATEGTAALGVGAEDKDSAAHLEVEGLSREQRGRARRREKGRETRKALRQGKVLRRVRFRTHFNSTASARHSSTMTIASENMEKTYLAPLAQSEVVLRFRCGPSFWRALRAPA